ncbi:MAG: NADH-quinone oxidoreductase subunit J [Bacteroidota bacterium]
MGLESLIGYSVMFICGISALLMLITKNVIYSAYALVVTLLSIAILFVFLGVEFIAVVQTLIYAGGILVLIIFGVMLTGKSKVAGVFSEVSNLGYGLLFSISIFGILVYIIKQSNMETTGWIMAASSKPRTTLSIESIGEQLMTTYVLPFELAGFLLLVAMAGALVLGGMAIKKNIKDAA